MKKFSITLLFLLITFSFSGYSVSQPKFTLDVEIGYSQPLGDFKNNFSLTDTVPSEWPYLMKTGYSLGVNAKYVPGNSKNIKLVLGLNYNGFKNWGDLYAPVLDSNGVYTNETAVKEFLPKVAILVVSLGGEYSFNPRSDINPFLGLDFTTNFFSGSYQTNPSSNFPQSQLKAETRFGLQLGGGVDFAFSKSLGTVLGVKYNLANLIGKSEQGTDASKIYLADDSQGSEGSRNISYLNFYLAFSFYFGN